MCKFYDGGLIPLENGNIHTQKHFEGNEEDT